MGTCEGEDAPQDRPGQLASAVDAAPQINAGKTRPRTESGMALESTQQAHLALQTG